MRTIVLSNIRLAIAATSVVVMTGCDGEIRPPKVRPAGTDTAAQPPAGAAPAGTNPAGSAPAGTSGDARAIGSLATRELIDVCMGSHDNLTRALAAQVQIECTASSLSTSGGCESARDKCMDDNKPEASADNHADCEMEAAALAQDCATVTVGALRGCEQAWIRKLEGTADQLGCDSSLDHIQQMSDRETPAECQNVDTRCSNQWRL